MSTLTKTLIVLLTIASIFLCGIVATFVAASDNYKKKYTDTREQLMSARKNEEDQSKQLREYKEKAQQREDNLESQISSLEGQISELKAELNNSERTKAELQERVNEWVAVTRDFEETNARQREMLANAQAEVKELEAAKIKLNKQLKQTNDYLETRLAIIEDLETKVKQLREEKVELQEMLAQKLMPSGKVPGELETVTPEISKARPGFRRPGVREIRLNGKITDLALEESMAEISLGTADGVREGMTFYVTRKDKFVCELLIIDVDVERGIGIIERKKMAPEVGDKVSTNL